MLAATVIVPANAGQALELLVKQKRLAKTAPIPCVIRIDGLAEEDSLAENVFRAPLLGCVARMSSEQHDCHEQMLARGTMFSPTS